MNILICSAGRRNDLVSYFRDCDAVSKIVVCDASENAASFLAADVSYVAPTINSDNYKSFLLDICEKEDISILLSLNDYELPLLSDLKDALQSQGTTAVVSDSHVIDICLDKTKALAFLSGKNMDVPDTYSYDDVIQGNASFPLIIKPRFGSASLGIEIATSIEEFELYYKYSKMKVNKAFSRNSVAFNSDILIQKKVEGVEYAVDIVNDLNGHYYGCVIKEKIGIRHGDADCVKTVKHEAIELWCEKLSAHLRHIGNLDCDLICIADAIYCVDLNPRFGGAYPFSHLAGANIPELLVKWVSKRPVTEKLNYKCNVVLARTEKYLRLR